MRGYPMKGVRADVVRSNAVNGGTRWATTCTSGSPSIVIPSGVSRRRTQSRNRHHPGRGAPLPGRWRFLICPTAWAPGLRYARAPLGMTQRIKSGCVRPRRGAVVPTQAPRSRSSPALHPVSPVRFCFSCSVTVGTGAREKRDEGIAAVACCHHVTRCHAGSETRTGRATCRPATSWSNTK